ncbi:SpoIIE family protein phosphatase [Lutibaculum baratangense]|uniref:Anti-sigma B factor RsbT n=1 Tax=Lutibaculum baratangense AMV1 TaxID=631454 RepID=V4QUV5_9HYPH|nr:SpoIIE family protein phosphatase [Lutibaculum baratangense]ESR23527.1 Anti-sigma B factor RsbT [Lutibaculum baratangense AMV1]
MISLPVVEASQVGGARRRALHEAESLGMPSDLQDRLAIIVTEIATNLLRHAREGEVVLVPERRGPHLGMTVIGMDLGPGITAVETAFEDGYTTAGEGGRGIGGGLGAIRRLSDEFDFHTDQGGTTVLAKVASGAAPSSPDAVTAEGLIVPKPGFDAGGDAFAVRHETDATLVLLLDVLGHGATAAEEATRGAAAFEECSGDSLDEAHREVCRALEGGRGAASLIVRIPSEGGVLTGIGLGNVRGEIVSPDGSRRGIPCAPGIVGATQKHPRQTEHEWPQGATLVMSTDGLRNADRTGESPALFSRRPLAIAATLYKRRRRGTDDCGIVVARGAA